ncbi:hypothetical protein BC830DRAFT_1167233 [Chytriomyces sp. MP71]|nr:hypothetical protein BC830DRAFT_1167233 [Chytriomyces sp. MP71]
MEDQASPRPAGSQRRVAASRGGISGARITNVGGSSNADSPVLGQLQPSPHQFGLRSDVRGYESIGGLAPEPASRSWFDWSTWRNNSGASWTWCIPSGTRRADAIPTTELREQPEFNLYSYSYALLSKCLAPRAASRVARAVPSFLTFVACILLLVAMLSFTGSSDVPGDPGGTPGPTFTTGSPAPTSTSRERPAPTPIKDYRLPTAFSPSKYSLSLTVDPKQEVFAGQVAIEIELTSSSILTNNITLHAKELYFSASNISLYGAAVDPDAGVDPDFPEARHVTSSHFVIASVHNRIYSDIDNPNFSAPRPSKPLIPTRLQFDSASDQVIISFPHPIRPATNKESKKPSTLTLIISYTGYIGYRTKRGFFKSPVGAPGKKGKQQFIAATHFEPLSARRAFPCFDEPALKATFSITIAAPKGYTVVSNTEVVEVVGLPWVDPWYAWKFEETKAPMSNYLVAWGVGAVQALEMKLDPKVPGNASLLAEDRMVRRIRDYGAELVDRAPATMYKGGLVIRAFVYEGVSTDDVRFALRVAADSIRHYEDMFGIPFPMSKVDLWPMPDFSGEAMENWGLVIFEAAGLLVKTVDLEPGNNTLDAWTAKSDPDHQIYVSNLVAHELAHQWLGDLVTMAWWNDLFLNEAFAEWGQYFGTEAAWPGWDVWGRFFELEHLSVFEREAGGGWTRGTSLKVGDVVSDGDVFRMFDDTTYSKGAAILRMFDFWLDEAEPNPPTLFRNESETPPKFICTPWCRVVRQYLKKNAHKAVDAKALYAAVDLEDPSGLMGTAFKGWIEKPGIPVVWVDKDGKVRQERFTGWRAEGGQMRRRSEGDKSDGKGWYLSFKYEYVDTNGTVPEDGLKLGGEDRWVTKERKEEGTRFMLVNKGRRSLYLFKPTVGDMKLMALYLKRNATALDPVDRAGLVADLIALTLANYVLPNQSFPVLEYLSQETHPSVWRAAIPGLHKLLRTMEMHEGYIPLRQFVKQLVFPVAEYAGWWPECKVNVTDNTFEMKQLRATVLPFAVSLGHTKTVNIALDWFQKWVKAARAIALDPKPPLPPVRTPCFQVVEDEAVVRQVMYEAAVRAGDDLAAVTDLLNATLPLPGDLESERLYPLAASKHAFHWKRLLGVDSGQLVVLGGQGLFSEADWFNRVSAVVKNSREQGAIEFAWDIVRWGRFNTAEQGETIWERLLYNATLDADDILEALVGASWMGGAVWRDAVKILEKSDEAGGIEAHVVTAVRRGVARSESASLFRFVLGDAVVQALDK